jgi:hypothetical protein
MEENKNEKVGILLVFTLAFILKILPVSQDKVEDQI